MQNKNTVYSLLVTRKYSVQFHIGTIKCFKVLNRSTYGLNPLMREDPSLVVGHHGLLTMMIIMMRKNG